MYAFKWFYDLLFLVGRGHFSHCWAIFGSVSFLKLLNSLKCSAFCLWNQNFVWNLNNLKLYRYKHKLYKHTHTHARTNAHAVTHKHARTHIHMHYHKHTHTHSCMHACTHMHAYTHTCAHTHTHIHNTAHINVDAWTVRFGNWHSLTQLHMVVQKWYGIVFEGNRHITSVLGGIWHFTVGSGIVSEVNCHFTLYVGNVLKTIVTLHFTSGVCWRQLSLYSYSFHQ